MEAPEVRITAAGAWTYLRLYRVAVEQQAERILPRLTSDEETDGRWADCMLFVGAVRNVERAARFVGKQLPPAERRQVDVLVEDFLFAVPDAATIRNFLWHFDEYELGKGNAKAYKGSRGALMYESATHETTINLLMFPGGWLRVPIAQTREAVRELADAVTEIVFPDGQAPASAMDRLEDDS